MTPQAVRGSGQPYKRLDDARAAFFDKEYPKMFEDVAVIKTGHKLATTAAAALALAHQGDESAVELVKAFLLENNKSLAAASGVGEVRRTLCLMDATGSMCSLIANTKRAIATMFARAGEVLRERGNETQIEFQFACYRNYDCDADSILQVRYFSIPLSNF
jgi:hypothetical protein